MIQLWYTYYIYMYTYISWYVIYARGISLCHLYIKSCVRYDSCKYVKDSNYSAFYASIHVYTNMYIYTHTYIYVYIYLYICNNVVMSIYIYINMFHNVVMSIYIYITWYVIYARDMSQMHRKHCICNASHFYKNHVTHTTRDITQMHRKPYIWKASHILQESCLTHDSMYIWPIFCIYDSSIHWRRNGAWVMCVSDILYLSTGRGDLG